MLASLLLTVIETLGGDPAAVWLDYAQALCSDICETDCD